MKQLQKKFECRCDAAVPREWACDSSPSACGATHFCEGLTPSPPALGADTYDLDLSCAWHGEDWCPQIKWSVVWCAEDILNIGVSQTANDGGSQGLGGGPGSY